MALGNELYGFVDFMPLAIDEAVSDVFVDFSPLIGECVHGLLEEIKPHQPAEGSQSLIFAKGEVPTRETGGTPDCVPVVCRKGIPKGISKLVVDRVGLDDVLYRLQAVALGESHGLARLQT